jgi:phospholipase C
MTQRGLWKKLWASTAILITFDEGGGYYDSGYVGPEASTTN